MRRQQRVAIGERPRPVRRRTRATTAHRTLTSRFDRSNGALCLSATELLGSRPTAPSLEVAAHEAVEQIVHDLKGPLWAIALEASVLDDKLAGGERADIRIAIARISRNVAFLDRMVQGMLDSTTLAAGHFELHRTPAELGALLAEVIDRVVPPRDRGRVVLDAPREVTLPIDVLRIERVVANLLHNALKYASPGSPITLRLEGDAVGARVSVSDHGPGMTADEMPHVFDKYRRASAARAHEGSGLGLYISKQILEAHGGTIGVESVSGIGSRFFFALPIS